MDMSGSRRESAAAQASLLDLRFNLPLGPILVHVQNLAGKPKRKDAIAAGMPFLGVLFLSMSRSTSWIHPWPRLARGGDEAVCSYSPVRGLPRMVFIPRVPLRSHLAVHGESRRTAKKGDRKL